jgi:hypothetical protein
MQSSMLTIYIHQHGRQLLSDQRIHDIPESIPPKQFEEYIELQKSQIQRSKDEIEELQQRKPRHRPQSVFFFQVVKNRVTMADNSRFMGAAVEAKKLGSDPNLTYQS